jgi:hypothetical protein
MSAPVAQGGDLSRGLQMRCFGGLVLSKWPDAQNFYVLLRN